MLALIAAELAGTGAVVWKAWNQHLALRSASEDLAFSVYQLAKEYRQVLIEAYDGSTTADVALRRDIFISRVNIVKNDAIFKPLRNGPLGPRLQQFFIKMKPVTDMAGRSGNLQDVETIRSTLITHRRLLDDLTLDLTVQVRKEQAYQRRAYSDIIAKAAVLLFLLLLTLAILTMGNWKAGRALRKSLDETANQSRGLLNLFDFIMEPCIITSSTSDGHRRIIYANATALENWEDKETIRQLLQLHIPVSQPADTHSLPHPQVLIDDHIYEVTCTDVSALKLEQSPSTMLYLLKDITKTSLAGHRERELSEKLAEAEEFRFMGSLAASIVHEIRQPLAAASNFLYVANDALSEREGEQNIPYLLDRSREMVRRTEHIARQLRSLIPADRESWVEVGLYAMLLEAESVVRASAAFKSKLVIRPSPLLKCRAMPIQITQIFINLIRNSLEASDRAGDGLIVEAWAQEKNGLAEVHVKDRAGGITQDLAATLFEPVKSKKPHGLGLGLAISRHLTEQFGGRLHYFNNNQGGATFVVEMKMTLRQTGTEVDWHAAQ